ncbi:hypothetical protein CSA37_02485 [Candidatus Fermentibacteria bacterium]|nr:MAG: hypothetical protein CSA37_02485 [Candidatus Fermentibacteria bacterium]
MFFQVIFLPSCFCTSSMTSGKPIPRALSFSVVGIPSFVQLLLYTASRTFRSGLLCIFRWQQPWLH